MSRACRCLQDVTTRAGREIRITPDEAVADAVATVFAYADRLASARSVMLRLVAWSRRQLRRRSTDQQVGRRRHTGGARYLTNPCHTGVCAYGRRRHRRAVEEGSCESGWWWPRARSGSPPPRARPSQRETPNRRPRRRLPFPSESFWLPRLGILPVREVRDMEIPILTDRDDVPAYPRSALQGESRLALTTVDGRRGLR